MKKKLFTLFAFAATNLTIAAPQPQSTIKLVPTQAQFAQLLKQQQGKLTTSCEQQNLKNLPKADTRTKKMVHSFCSCVAHNLSTNTNYITQQYKATTSSKTPQEITTKIQHITQVVAKACQQQVNKY